MWVTTRVSPRATRSRSSRRPLTIGFPRIRSLSSVLVGFTKSAGEPVSWVHLNYGLRMPLSSNVSSRIHTKRLMVAMSTSVE